MNKIFTFCCCWIVGIFAGMNANLFSVMVPVTIPDLLHTTDRAVISQIGSYILFSFLMGWMFGGIVFGILGDRFGRINAMVLSICFYTISTGLMALATTSTEVFFYRFLTGLGVGGAMLSISVLLSEVWPSRSRAIAVGSVITSYQAGVFLSGFIPHFISDWRLVFGLGAIPVLMAALIKYKLQESEMWKKNVSQALSSPIRTVFHSEHRFNLVVGSIAFGSLLVGYWASLSWVPAWIQDLVGQSDGKEKTMATMYHAFAAMTGCVLSGYLANLFGRVPVILGSFTGAFLASAWMFLSNQSFSEIIYFQHALLGLFAGIAQAVMYIYLPELFPTNVRATAVGFCLNLGRIVTSILVLFVGVLVTAFGSYSITLFAFSCIYMIGTVAVSVIPKAMAAQAIE